MNDLLMLSTTPFLGTLGFELYRVLTRRCEPVFEMLCDPALDLKTRGPDTLCELYRGALGFASGCTAESRSTFVLSSASGLIQARLSFEQGQAHLMIKRYGAYKSEDLEALEHQYTVLEWALKGDVSAINSLFIVLASMLQGLKGRRNAKLVQRCLLEGVEALEREALLPPYEALGTLIRDGQRLVLLQRRENRETFLYDFNRWCSALNSCLEHGGTMRMHPQARVVDYLPTSSVEQVLERFVDV